MTATRTATGVFGRSQELSARAHEQVVFCEDAKSGLKAIIAAAEQRRTAAAITDPEYTV